MPEYYDLEVSLLGVEPRIWRKFLISGEATFYDLHDAIQVACGWSNYHLYDFLGDIKGRIGKYGLEGTRARRIARSDEAEPYAEEEARVPPARRLKLRGYFQGETKRCFYRYDFGDGWEHEVVLKGVVELPERFKRRLVGGARAFPPEDCGGIPGYEECCEAVRLSDEELADLEKRDPETWEAMQDRRGWVGDWDPERFDLEATRRWFDY